jgi:CotS family spore coat protein
MNYTMHDWVPGVQADMMNLCQLTQAVEMLAWFHRCSRGFESGESQDVRVEWGSWPRRFVSRIEDLYRYEDEAKAAGDEDRFSRHFLKRFDDFITEAADALKELESGPYDGVVRAERERGGLCHRDYTDKNLVLRDDGALYLSDFDDLSMDSRLEDLGKFMQQQAGWDLERALFILQVYHGVNPLSHADVTCLAAYLRFPTEFWSAANDHFVGKKADRHDLKHLAGQLPAKNKFLEELRRADLGFLVGTGPLYSLGFANLPEVPPGKAWAATPWPSPDGAEMADAGWWQTMPLEPAINEPVTEPPDGFDPPGTVLDDIGTVELGGVWPEGSLGGTLDARFFQEPLYGRPAETEPVQAEPEVAPPEQEVALSVVPKPVLEAEAEKTATPAKLAWRPFPAPLRHHG